VGAEEQTQEAAPAELAVCDEFRSAAHDDRLVEIVRSLGGVDQHAGEIVAGDVPDASLVSWAQHA
jgi:hypothetical protein